MKKIFTLFALAVTTCAIAQPNGKVFTITTAPYTYLTGSTVISEKDWDDFDADLPLGFNYNMFGRTNDSLIMRSGFGGGADMGVETNGIANGFIFGTDFIDRSWGGVDSSLISYKVQTVNNKKIAKVEWRNTGFYNEFNSLGSTDDSVNFQVWLYEGSNDLEVHYGPSSILSPNNVLFQYAKPFFGFIKNIDLQTGSIDWAYYVSSTNPPKVDSLDGAAYGSATTLGFAAWPSNGTVFKFSDVINGVDGVKLNDFTSVYPTVFSTQFFVSISKAGFRGNICLLDMNGRTVLSQPVTEGKTSLDVTPLAAGNYALVIRTASETVIYKVTKN